MMRAWKVQAWLFVGLILALALASPATRAQVPPTAISREAPSGTEDARASVLGFLSATKHGFQRQLGRFQDFASRTGIRPPPAGADAFGMGAGLPPAFGTAALRPPPPPPGAETFAEAYSEQARLVREAHPIAAGLGSALAVAPPFLLLALLCLRWIVGEERVADVDPDARRLHRRRRGG